MVFVRELGNDANENGFVQRSTTESVCGFCFQSVKVGVPGRLILAESVHCLFALLIRSLHLLSSKMSLPKNGQ
jgi:hypothetical protein